MAFKWTCPYCKRDTVIGNENYRTGYSDLMLANKYGHRRLNIDWIVCPNPDCQEIILTAKFGKLEWLQSEWRFTNELKSWPLIPRSTSILFPEYVPQAIRNDYEEACAILHDSPKASATLSRRCLQGMIRDFWKVSKSRLVDEIDAIKDKIDPLTWKSIDAVRKVGNIGAHMEKDINLIVDVNPDEATLLIKLIELLIKEWYIHRKEREDQLNSIISVSEAKEIEKKPS